VAGAGPQSPGAAGLQLFARYAYPPNSLGYCGPPDHQALLEYAATGTTDAGLGQLARAFSGPWPYLTLIAGAAGIADPFDYRVVEAYWIGNELLEDVDVADFGNRLREEFRPRAGSRWQFLEEAVPARAVCHHSFHVFGVYPWAGVLRSGRVEEPMHVLERCRIRWGRVVGVDAAHATVESRPLRWDGRLLELGDPRHERVLRSANGTGFLDELAPGDVVSLHWDWVCDRLTPRQLANLRRYTQRQLDITNARTTHPGTDLALT
jgi:hypothetical protein